MQADLRGTFSEKLAAAGFSPDEVALIQENGGIAVQSLAYFSSPEMRQILDALTYIYAAQNIVTRDGRGMGISERFCPPGTLALKKSGLVNVEVLNTVKVIHTTSSGEQIARAVMRERVHRLDVAAFARDINPLVPLLVAASSHGKYVQKSFSAHTPVRDGGAFLDFLMYQNSVLTHHFSFFGKKLVDARIGVIVDQGNEGRYFVFPPEVVEIINSLLHNVPDEQLRHYIAITEHVRRKYIALVWLRTARSSGGDALSPELVADLTTYLEQLKPVAEVLRISPDHGDIRYIVRNEEGYSHALAALRQLLRKELAAHLDPSFHAEIIPDSPDSTVSIPVEGLPVQPGVPHVPTSEDLLTPPQEPHTPLHNPVPVPPAYEVPHFPSVRAPDEPERAEALTVFLGSSREGQKVFWAPGDLNNGHCILIGGSGAGKTETLRCIARELDREGFPVLMIDFHGDMAFPTRRLSTYRIREGGEYYFNPLELDPAFTEITPLRATSDFVDAISINFPTLGIQQRRAIKGILKEAYQRAGVGLDPKTWVRTLDFDAVQDQILACEDETIPAYLEDIFDYRLFTGRHKLGIKDVLKEGITHVNLNALPENLRYLFADLFLRRLFYSLQAMGEIPRDAALDRERFRLFVIVDEAKLLVSQKSGQKQAIKAVLNKYATEMRKFGVGLILASQLISHFNDEILANIAVKFCMRTENKKQAQENSRFFEVGEEDLMNLSPGEGILSIGSEKLNIRVLPLSARDS